MSSLLILNCVFTSVTLTLSCSQSGRTNGIVSRSQFADTSRTDRVRYWCLHCSSEALRTKPHPSETYQTPESEASLVAGGDSLVGSPASECLTMINTSYGVRPIETDDVKSAETDGGHSITVNI